MNWQQRNQNRRTAEALRLSNLHKIPCERCKKPGRHWISAPMTLQDIISGNAEYSGFWTCDDLYDSVTGRRIGH